MALTQLGTPYPVFTDLDGKPLDAGFLYFGVQNQNPETNPITVYYDAALTQPAAQPLRTSNGYVMRNGSPAILYAGVEFSVTVRNQRGELVIYAPTSFGLSIPSTYGGPTTDDVAALLADVTFTYTAAQVGTVVAGDIIQTRKEGFSYEVAASGASDQHVTTAGGVKLYVVPQENGYNIEAFGAVGDDSTDSVTFIQAAIDAAFADGGGTVFIPKGTFVTSTRLLRKSKVWIRGEGRESYIKNTATSFFDTFVIVDGWMHEADWVNQVYYNVNAYGKGATDLTLSTPSNASNFTVDDIVFMYRGFPGNVANNALYAEIVRIKAVDAGTGVITVDVRMPHGTTEKIDYRYNDFDVAETYAEGDIVFHSGKHYASLVNSNTGNTPTGVTDANWQVETIGFTFNDQASNGGGETCYMVDGGGIEKIGLSNDTGALWQARCAVLGAVYRDIYVYASSTLFGGNGFNRCVFDNVQGYFRQGFTEMAEGTNKTVIKNCFGQFIESALTPDNQIITCSRPGMVIDSCVVDGGNNAWSQLVRFGSNTASQRSYMRNCNITGAPTEAVLEMTTSFATVEGNTFNGNGTSCNILIKAANKTRRNDILSNTFRDFDVSAAIIRSVAASNAEMQEYKFIGNSVLGTISTGNFDILGSNGTFSNNYIEQLPTAIDFDSCDAWGTWSVHGNSRDNGDAWDHQAVEKFGDYAMQWYDRAVISIIATGPTITLPVMESVSVSNGYAITNLDPAVAITVSVEDTGSETIQVSRTSFSATTLSIAALETKVFYRNTAGTRWVAR